MADTKDLDRGIFTMYDKNGDGKITPKETFKLMSDVEKKFPREDADHWVKWADENEDGEVSLEEFVAAQKAHERNEKPAAAAKRTIRATDLDGDGMVSVDEAAKLKNVLDGERMSEEEKKDFLKADSNGDSLIDVAELTKTLTGEGVGQDKGEDVRSEPAGDEDEDAREVEDVIEAEVEEEEMGETKPRMLLRGDAMMQQLNSRIAASAISAASLPPPRAHWLAPAAGGSVAVSLLVAAVGCRRRLRAPFLSELAE